MADMHLEKEETIDLIASNKVEGTSVYNRGNEHLGSIFNFMVNKRSGQVDYAVLSFGGFLGIGNEYYPIPWDMLTYDPQAGGHGGYIVDLDKEALKDAPRYAADREPTFDRTFGERIYVYYGLEYPHI